MNWKSDELKVAALPRLLGGSLRRTQEYRRYLGTRWPDYAELARAFTDRGVESSVAALRALRRAHLPTPTGRTLLNRKTWAAWASAHSKATDILPPESVTLTRDDVLRVHVNEGLVLRSADGREQDLSSLQALAAEVVLAERSFGREWALTGQLPALAVTMENHGCLRGCAAASGHAAYPRPGWNSGLTGQVMARLPASVPWWHFGDLDPNGLRIGLNMRAAGQPDRQPVLWIPKVASPLLESHSLPLSATPWPLQDIPDHLLSHPAVAWLASRGRWLEQKVMVLMPAFEQEFPDTVSRLLRSVP